MSADSESSLCGHTWAFLCGPRYGLRCYFPGLVYLGFFEAGSLIGLGPSRLGWEASEPQRSARNLPVSNPLTLELKVL